MTYGGEYRHQVKSDVQISCQEERVRTRGVNDIWCASLMSNNMCNAVVVMACPDPYLVLLLQLHSQVDLAVTWTATTAGRLISNRCLRRCGNDANSPCEECAKLRHSHFIKNLSRPGFLRTGPGAQFLTFQELHRRVCLPHFPYSVFRAHELIWLLTTCCL